MTAISPRSFQATIGLSDRLDGLRNGPELDTRFRGEHFVTRKTLFPRSGGNDLLPFRGVLRVNPGVYVRLVPERE